MKLNHLAITVLLLLQQFYILPANASGNAYQKACSYTHFEANTGMTGPENFYYTMVPIGVDCPPPPNPNGIPHNMAYSHNSRGVEIYRGVTQGNRNCEITAQGTPIYGDNVKFE